MDAASAARGIFSPIDKELPRTSLSGTDQKIAKLEKLAFADVKKGRAPRGATEIEGGIAELTSYTASYLKFAEKKIQTLGGKVEQARAQAKDLEEVNSITFESVQVEALMATGMSREEAESMLNQPPTAAPQRLSDSELEALFAPPPEPLAPSQIQEESIDVEAFMKVEADKIDTRALQKGLIGAVGLSQAQRDEAADFLQGQLKGAPTTREIDAFLSQIRDGTATAKDVEHLRQHIMVAKNRFNALQ